MFFGRSSETATMQRELCEGEQGKATHTLWSPAVRQIIDYQEFSRTPRLFTSVGCSILSPELYTAFRRTILVQMADKISEEFHEQFQQSAPDWNRVNNTDPLVSFKRVIQGCLAQIQGSRLILALGRIWWSD